MKAGTQFCSPMCPHSWDYVCLINWDSDSVTRMTEAAFLGLFKGGHGGRQIGEYLTHLRVPSFFKISLYHCHTFNVGIFCSYFTDENLRPRMIA